MKDRIICPKYLWLNVLISVIFIGFTSLVGYMFFTRSGFNYLTIMLFVLSFFISIPLGNYLHELAHCIVGIICGYKVKMQSQTFFASLFSSNECMLQPKRDRHIKCSFVVVTLSGIAVNLAIVVMGCLSLFVLPHSFVIFALFSPWSLYLFLLNVLPLEYESGKTDMLIAWEIISKSDTGKVLINILRVQAQAAEHGLENVDKNLLFDLPQLPDDDINFMYLTKLRYEYFIAKGQEDEAKRYLIRLITLENYLPPEYIKAINSQE